MDISVFSHEKSGNPVLLITFEKSSETNSFPQLYF